MHSGWMKKPIVGLIAILLSTCCTRQVREKDDLYTLAIRSKDDLRLSVYLTAHTLDGLLSTEAGRRESVSMLKANGITKVYLEVYRSGLAVPDEKLISAREFYQENGFDVVGGIATVPGGDFGVPQEGKLGWFNWQNEKTQHDLRQVIERTAPIFDTFIIDDFLCTGDTSRESKTARGNRSWSQYRRDLLTGLSKTVFIDPAKKRNPNIQMIIKYPQWYDRFHLFGYDVAREPALFDQVWVGTETRGQYTQRFGFVQPYEGFVNYRWLATIAGSKIGGAWFDHGDCDATDFIEQAYQSVLAGVKELVLFNYGSFAEDHPGHHLLRLEFNNLVKLAKAVAADPVVGVAGYKPPNSDAGGDLYIMDFIGMLGIPLVPVSQYPDNAKVIFLPAQSAADTAIITKINRSLNQGARIIMTSGFLTKVKGVEKLMDKTGLVAPIVSKPVSSNQLLVDGEMVTMQLPLDMEAKFRVNTASVLLTALVDGEKIPFLTKSQSGQIYVLNTHTFSQRDFDAVGEVLLAPKPLGILEIPRIWANVLREPFLAPLSWQLDSPTRVVLQPLGNSSFMVHNYNRQEAAVRLIPPANRIYHNVLTNETIQSDDHGMNIKLGPRSRIWIK